MTEAINNGWLNIDDAPKDGTRILAIEGTDSQLVPVVCHWMDDGDVKGWVATEELLSDVIDELTPILWTPIPSMNF